MLFRLYPLEDLWKCESNQVGRCFRANMEMDRLEKVRENDTLGLRLKVKHLEAKNSALAASLEAKVCFLKLLSK